MEKKLLVGLVGSVLLTQLAVTESWAAPPLLQQSDLVYKGAFRLPSGKFGTVSTQNNSFSTDAGRALSYNPQNNSLFMMGNKKEILLAELQIPSTIVNSTNKLDLTYATVKQNPVEITSGLGCFVGPAGASKCYSNSSLMTAGNVLLGGTLMDALNNKLIGTTFVTYDANANTTFSHFTANPDWTTNGADTKGMYRVGTRVEDNNALSAGFIGGYMTWIPEEWQAAFGARALTGQAAQAIITRTSFGPSAFAFNPEELGNGTKGTETDPVSAQPMVYYPSTHPTLGAYDNKVTVTPTYNQVTEVTGVAFPRGTSSVLFFGRTGYGLTCYGSGTTDASQAANNGTINEWLKANNPDYPTLTTLYTCGSAKMDGKGNDDCCYDPASSAKGVHGYPYAYYAWAYDANEMLKVKNGQLKPWEVVPYAQWDLGANLDPFAPAGGDGIAGHGNKRIFGAAYDPGTQNIYVTQANGDKLGLESLPLVHVFHVQTGATTDQTPPGVFVFSPTVSSTVSGIVDVNVAVKDNNSLGKVELYLDNQLQGTITSAPYTFKWDTSRLVSGNYKIHAKAYDAAGNVGESAEVPLVVSSLATATPPVTTVDTMAPTLTSFVLPATASALNVGLTIAGTDNVAVTGYRLSESSTAPTASSTGWTSTVPTSFTFASPGSHTLYAWAKDTAGNISASRSALVTITLPDTTAPQVTGFTMPTTSSSPSVPVSTLTATDNVAVTGYRLSESATAPTASSTGWSSTAPTSFTFAATGSRTVYVWAKDAAGNVSAARSASVSIASADTVAPLVTGFTMPASYKSRTVPVSVSATDAVRVTAYRISESSTWPTASSTGWSASSPTSFTFAGTGSRTAYVWAKDAAGNISAAKSATVLVDVTLPVITSVSVNGPATSLSVKASATDNISVTSMQLYIDASTTPVLQVSGATLNYLGSITNGSHTLTVKAYDKAGNVRSQQVKVTK